ncbi:MAG: Fe-S cluster assembly protein SufD [Gammaproteobacteria bacterium]
MGAPVAIATALAALDADARGADRLTALRRAAAARVREQGLPSIKLEDWKYTSLAALDQRALRAAEPADGESLSPESFAALALAAASPLRAVLVNGRFRPDLGSRDAPPAGVTLRSLRELAEQEPDRLASLLGEDAARGNALVALNTALARDGVLIDVAPGTRLHEPLHLVLIGTGGELMSNPRVLVRLGRDSELTLIEEYLSAGADLTVTNSQADIELEPGAVLHHHRLQAAGADSTHLGRIAVRVDAQAEYASDALAFGARLARVDIDVRLAGRGAKCRLNGLFVGAGEQHLDHHTRVDHLVGDTHSSELYRGILDDRSRGVFNGKVVVARDAQGITAQQASHNLLLTRTAEVDTKPELEIYADDVSCSHGATVGELDATALFYLRSRGVPEAEARALLTYAFAERVVEAIPLPAVRHWIEQRFLGHTELTQTLKAFNAP